MIAAIELRTEYLVNPLGIDILKPRLFWKVTDAKRQMAYEIRYRVNKKLVDDVQKVECSSMYADVILPLQSRDKVEWRVRLTDENGSVGAWSEWAWFEMGFLQKDDWNASWIMGDYEHSQKAAVRYPVDCFQRNFLVQQPVDKARLYITSCGMYEAYLNGEKIGDRVLTPGSTSFQKRVHYQVYDVTAQLAEQNCLSIELADGFYSR